MRDRLLRIVVLTAGVTLVALVSYLESLAGGYPLLFIALMLALADGLPAMLLVGRSQGADGYTAPPDGPSIHQGISMHAIPISGPMGAVFAAGYVVMFWFGVPGYQPIVLGLGVVGALLGGFFIFVVERRGMVESDGRVLRLER